MELGQVQEDYLEAIYVLREKSGQVKCVHLADYMERSKPTILTAMKVLEEKGYIVKNRHSPASYTKRRGAGQESI